MPTRHGKRSVKSAKVRTVAVTAAVEPQDSVCDVSGAEMDTIVLERDMLMLECVKNREERAEFQKMAAQYCKERQEMMLECNMMRESMRQSRMLVEADEMELEVERYLLMRESGNLHRMRVSLDIMHGHGY
jgi:hypothetical protein